MTTSTPSASFASNLQEIIRMARICLSKEELAEFLARLADQHELKEAA